MFILLYANCVVMYCVSFDVVVGNKLYLILSYLVFGYKVFLKVYFNVKIHADLKSVDSQLSVLKNPCFK